MKLSTKIIALGITATVLAGGVSVPIIPTDIVCSVAGNETQFDTSDGYLHQGQWAQAEKGFYWVNTNGVKKVTDTYDVSGLQAVGVVGERYWRICDSGNAIVKDTQMTKAEYDGLKTEGGIKRQVLDSLLETVLFPVASAAIANDATTSARNSTGSSLTIAFTCTNNNTYLAVTTNAQDSNHANLPVTSVTYNSNPLTIIRSDEAAGNTRTEAWGYKPGTDCGSSHNVVAAATGPIGEFQVYVASYTGVDQTTPNDANTGSSGNSSTASVAITTVADNAWIVSQVSYEASITGNGTGQTTNSTLTDQSFENGRQSYEGPKTPAGSDTQSFTGSFGASWAITSISLAPATAAGSSATHTKVIDKGAKSVLKSGRWIIK